MHSTEHYKDNDKLFLPPTYLPGVSNEFTVVADDPIDDSFRFDSTDKNEPDARLSGTIPSWLAGKSSSLSCSCPVVNPWWLSSPPFVEVQRENPRGKPDLQEKQ